ncbi:HET-domain-containing protein [Hypoxylon sp. FL1150]|nr:HET-domain-containing protein [Hypoxylon sp. FL1150]
MQDYQYRLLHPGEIRLIKLLPGCLGGGLQCELLHVPSPDSQSYEAISYVWGTNEKTHAITVGNARIRITANLYQALCHIRQHSTECILWADAICINQVDTQERNHQVKSMAQIYSSASEVLIWLGSRQDDVELAFQIILQADRIITGCGDENVSHKSRNETKGLDIFSRGASQSLRALLRRSWFHRVWIIQEAMLAKKATVKCGSLSIPFYTILRVYRHWHEEYPNQIPPGMSHRLVAMIQIRSATDRHQRLPLLELLRLTRIFEASDPRDKIFGLMSLVFDDANLGFQVDYSLSCAALYMQMAKHRIVRRKGLSFLGQAGLGLYPGDINIPSWVPDWSWCNRVHAELGYGGGFRAAISMTATIRVNSQNGLEVPAIFIDRIADVGTEMLLRRSQGGGKSAVKRLVGDLFSDLNRLSENLAPYPTGENVEDVKLRTTVFDFFGTENSTEWVPGYKSLHAFSDTYNEVRNFDSRKYQYLGILFDYTRRRVLCTTSRGYLGWVPDITVEGDLIVIFPGARVPFVVFPVGSGVYRLVGECYIHGIMYGEALEGAPPEEEITLI